MKYLITIFTPLIVTMMVYADQSIGSIESGSVTGKIEKGTSMFGLGSKGNYEDRIQSALSQNDMQKADKIAQEAFRDKKADESILGWISAVSFERQFKSSPKLLQQFGKRYPDSLHLPRIYLADLHARSGRFDTASDEARAYLRQCKDSEILNDLATKNILREGVSRSFLLLTAIYTEVGARSYSERVLRYSRRYSLSPEWIKIINTELSRLAQEKMNPANKAIDDKWEEFFAQGKHADELYDLCESKKSPLLAKRVDLLESHFRFKQSFKIGTNEILQIVYKDDENKFMLL